MLKLYKRTITRAFTLVESLVAISIISGIASVGYVGFIQIQASSKAVKLEQDIAVVNNALRVYEAHGGSIVALNRLNLKNECLGGSVRVSFSEIKT